MTRSVIRRPDSDLEFIEAAEWYGRRDGLATAFIETSAAGEHFEQARFKALLRDA
jgi:hypothetical protein